MHKLFVGTAVLATTALLTACGGKDNKTNQSTPAVSEDRGTISSKHVRTPQPIPPKFITDGAFEKRASADIKQFTDAKNISYLQDKSYKIAIGNKSYDSGNNINLASFKQGLNNLDTTAESEITADDVDYTVKTTGKLYLYNQNFSALAHYLPKNLTVTNKQNEEVFSQRQTEYLTFVKGTTTTEVPREGKATYRGKSFMERHGGLVQGELEYKVDFDLKIGSGKIISSSDGYGNIALVPGSIGVVNYKYDLDGTTIPTFGVESVATNDTLGRGTYAVAFFGDNAQEIVGEATFNNENRDGNRTVGFAGQMDPKMHGSLGLEKSN